MNQMRIDGFDQATAAEHSVAGDIPARTDQSRPEPIGMVIEIGGAGSRIALDLDRLAEISQDPDPSVALSGQVGSQIKIRVGSGWLLASIRNQKQDNSVAGGILAEADFLGEGQEERLTGRMNGFRRGVTFFPIPGAPVYPATSEDLRQIYASDGRSAIQIGNVYPTKDIRAGLYVDALLGKHFALLGSTGTGKSTDRKSVV